MADSKISFKIGNLEFSGEGDSEWLSSQLDKILGKVPELLNIEPLVQDRGPISAAVDILTKANGSSGPKLGASSGA